MSRVLTENGDGSKAPAASTQDQADVMQFLAALRGEIADLKRDQREVPPVSRQQELLASLRQEIGEARPAGHPAGQGSELDGMTAALKRDFASVKHGAPRAADPGLVAMLAGLRKELDELKHEQTAAHVPTRDQELHALFTELRRDMANLKKAQTDPAHGGSGLDGIMSGLRKDINTGRARAIRQPAVPAGSPKQSGSNLTGIVATLAMAALVLNAYLMLSARPGVDGPTKLAWAVPANETKGLVVAENLPFAALAMTPQSPLGESGNLLGADEALTKASALLTASGRGRNTDEAGYWLKRYLISSQAGRSTPRALTQLGSLYAEGIGSTEPDYHKARQLWEVSSAFGDPVAMCFVGRLLENGITAPANAIQASVWYLKARDAGGCPGLDESILRTRAQR